jgi:long-chain acyl-CoA synthetase
MPEFADQFAALRPQEIALRDDHHAYSWAEVGDRLNRVAHALNDCELGDSRRVAVFAENAAQTALAHLGALLGGASSVPVNFHLTAPEAAFILSDSSTRVLFVGPETYERGVAAAKLAGVPLVVAWRSDHLLEPPTSDDESLRVVPWDEWLAAAESNNPSDQIHPLPNMLYTSGTTGVPKGTELPPTMFAGGATVAEHLKGLVSSRFAGFGTHLIVGPMYHTGPLNGMRILAAGVPVVVLHHFDAEATLRAIESFGIESTVMVPTHFVRLLALDASVRDRYDVSSIRLVAHTGAKCPVDVKTNMINWWGPVFTDAYGATESGTVCSISSGDWLAHPGSVGRAVAPFSVRVYSESGALVGPNVEGRLFFADATGRGIVYPNDPEKSASAHIEPGVFTLGEIGYVDAEGFVYITDRESDMVVSGGANIYPAESEQVLLRHPAVLDVAVIGVPNADMGEELKALIMLKDSARASESELLDFCRSELTRYKCPRSIDFVETIGRTTMGKVNKRALRAPFWA